MSQAAASSILRLLSRKTDLYQQLLELQRRKTQLLLDGDNESLGQPGAEEDRLFERIRECNRSLQLLLGDETLSRRCQSLEAPTAAQVRGAAAALKQVGDELSRVNARNRRCMLMSLVCIQSALDRRKAVESSYDSSGSPQMRTVEPGHCRFTY